MLGVHLHRAQLILVRLALVNFVAEEFRLNRDIRQLIGKLVVGLEIVRLLQEI